MKKTLLATTAIVGATLLAAPANATVGSSDNMAVTLSGMFWFAAVIKDEDVSANNGRGYGFSVAESEIHIGASGTADNGIKYGVTIELNAGGADGTAADEAWAFMHSDAWGRIELGDNDDATNRMAVGAWNAVKGADGPAGGLSLNNLFNGIGATDGFIVRGDTSQLTVGDATKATYFSPRFSGFQIGASWTPDSGQDAGNSNLDADNDGDFENVLGLAANYAGTFDDIGVGISAHYEHGSDETGAAEIEDLNHWGVGVKVDFSGFTVGAHYVDLGDSQLTVAQTAAGADAGTVWSVGAGYQAGPWGVSAWYHKGEKNNVNTSPAGARVTEITRLGLGAGYSVAPGWDLRAELEFLSHDNGTTATGVGGTTDNDGRGFLLVNRFVF